MVKIKNAEILSLDKSDQRKVSKEAKQLKKQLETGEVVLKDDVKKRKSAERGKNRGLIYIGHIPHGFYEDEMKKYFTQFGKVTNVQVCRSRRTGNSKGYGFIEFHHPEVAKIAAETMNNYLMFKKRIVAHFIPFEKRPIGLFSGKRSTLYRYSVKVRREKQFAIKNKVIDNEVHLRKSKMRLRKLTQKLNKLQKCGIDVTLTPVTDAVNELADDTQITHKTSKRAKIVTRKTTKGSTNKTANEDKQVMTRQKKQSTEVETTKSKSASEKRIKNNDGTKNTKNKSSSPTEKKKSVMKTKSSKSEKAVVTKSTAIKKKKLISDKKPKSTKTSNLVRIQKKTK